MNTIEIFAIIRAAEMFAQTGDFATAEHKINEAKAYMPNLEASIKSLKRRIGEVETLIQSKNAPSASS